MDIAKELSGDITAAAAALAGLILVFLGAVSTSYDSYSATQQASVRTSFRLRVWLAFFGFLLSLVSAALSLLGKWYLSVALVNVAAVLLLGAFVIAAVAAFVAALDVK